MIVSVNDENIKALKGLYKINVLLDGKAVRFCTMADNKTGIVERLKTDINGKFVVDKQTGSILTVVEHGNVTIRFTRHD